MRPHISLNCSLLLRATAVVVTLLGFGVGHGAAQETVAEYTLGMEKRDGYFPLYWDADTGRLLMEVPRLDEQFLYLTSLATGFGSNRLGLDRGMIGNEGLARFSRVGPKVLLILDNPTFRAMGTDNDALIQSVDESFPTSTLGAFDVLAQEEERVLIDVTGLALRDVMGVQQRLSGAGQGNFALSRDRSVVHLPRTKAFPINTEIEGALTFTSDDPGSAVRRHAPEGRAVTVREHQSFVKLPDEEFRPRPFDTRIGIFGVAFFDFNRALDAGYENRYAIRHRLIKRNSGRAVSEPVEPIIYYLDRGVQEPYRTAFKEGIGWYGDLFLAAGFRNAFRIEDMPPDMDPMDARYDVIQWVHRTAAGSSIGPSFVDPRTGEIIKAAVRMDSHRSLVDFNLYAGALPATDAQSAYELLEADAEVGNWIATQDPDVSGEEFAMARRRQHAAHEVGHTLGLAHNFVAASYGRASVMDYPAPLIEVRDGDIVLRNAYRDGPGAYDSVAIRYAYAEFSEDEEEEGLRAIVDEAMARGLAFITNPDENAASSFPEATTWINGADALDEFERLLNVRRVLIDRFDESALEAGRPMYLLNRRFVAVYLHHRFGLTAATKAIGGMKFRYAVHGDTIAPTEIVPAARQARALELLFDALEPGELAVPERVLALMAPRPFGHQSDSRAFRSAAGPAFDQIGVARTLSEMVIGGLLVPERAARVVAFHDRDPSLPLLTDIIGRMVERTWLAPAPDDHIALRRVVERVLLDELMSLASHQDATVEARAGAIWGIAQVAEFLQEQEPISDATEAHYGMALSDIDRFFSRVEEAPAGAQPLRAPPGTPIGNH